MTKVSLFAKIDVDQERLAVSCSLTNDTGKSIHAFVALWTVDKDGNMRIDSHPTYASIDDERVLHLGKIAHPVPMEKFVERRIIPFVRQLAPAQKWEEKLEFKLPAQEYNPYYIATDKTLWDEITARAIRVCVDYVIDFDGLRLHETPIEGAFRLEHPELLKRLQRVTSEEVAVKVPGLRRADKFERFAC
jgi:hypothetical protein